MALENGHRLLTEDEYQQIINEGRAADVLRLFVKKKPGCPRKYEGMTRAEAARAYRANRRREVESVISHAPSEANDEVHSDGVDSDALHEK